MNFLLHCWLGRANDGLIAGGFLGDFVKGPIPTAYPVELQRGIALHRYIDTESNRLEAMRSTYFRFGKSLRRPAPILLDLVADHIFAKYWNEFTELPLTEFTSHCYQVIGQHEIPSSATRLYEHMCRTDHFARYRNVDVIYDVCHRILVRLRMEQHTKQLETILVSEHENFKEDFEVYFPILEQKVEAWLLET